METNPVLETEHLHYFFFFYSLLFVIFEYELKGKAHYVEDFKENSLLCIISRITAYRKKYCNRQLSKNFASARS